MDLHLDGQVAFVAGSSRGIGRAIAAALLAEGASIVLTGRDEASLKATQAELTTRETDHRVLAVRGDFTNAETIARAFDRTLGHFDRLDHLIANLGAGSGTPGWDAPAEEWTRLFELNFFASVRLTQAALPHLLAKKESLSSQPDASPSALSSRPEASHSSLSSRPEAEGRSGETPVFREASAEGTSKSTPDNPSSEPARATYNATGSILYISSIVAVEATPAPLPYSAAKAALVNYSKNLARQLGPKGIRVNTIAPGNIFFPRGSWERHLSNRREAVEAMLKNEVPQQRFGTPEEIASLAVYLCSPQAAFATGACYVMDGGQTRTL